MQQHDRERLWLDGALVKGLKIGCGSHQEAVAYRFRLYACRTADRKRNALIYPTDHPLHGRSEWDNLIISLKKPSSTIHIHPLTEPQMESPQ